MAPIVAPNVCRFSVVGDYAGEDVVNIFDVLITGLGGSTTSRTEAIPTVAGDLLNQWSDHVLGLLQPEYTAREIRWVDLDSEDGITGSVSSTDGSTWPEAGGQSGTGMPGNVCVNVRKLIAGTRGRRAGMTKLSGISEGYTLDGSPNLLDPAAATAINNAFEDLKDGINGATDYESNLVVVHTIDDVFDSTSPITNFQCRQVMGSLRRRMPGYGS